MAKIATWTRLDPWTPTASRRGLERRRRPRWTETIGSARALPEAGLNQNVDGEWSFVQTLRHLLFVSDSWVSRGMLGVRVPHHPLGLPPTGMKAVRVSTSTPARAWTQVLRLRAERTRMVDRVMTLLTDAELGDERRCLRPRRSQGRPLVRPALRHGRWSTRSGGTTTMPNATSADWSAGGAGSRQDLVPRPGGTAHCRTRESPRREIGRHGRRTTSSWSAADRPAW